MSDLLLPEGSRLVHIGPQKTGSTSIQVAMSEARDALLDHGVYYPRGSYRRRKAGWALGLPGGPGTPIRHWNDLVAEVAGAGDLRACVSDENYSRADSAVAARIVEGLGAERVHIVAVARRLDRYLPSKWQERVKSGVTLPYDEWLRDVLRDGQVRDESEWETWNTWQGHDIAALVERWLEVVEPDRFILVVADESDRGMLSRVFEELLGLPDGMLSPTSQQSNVGLGWSELELLRSLQDVFQRNDWSRTDWLATLPEVVSAFRDCPEPGLGPRTPPLPAWAVGRVAELSDARIDAIAGLPVRIVGNPDNLRAADERAQPQGVGAGLGLPVRLAAAAVEGALRAERRRVARPPEESPTPKGRPAHDYSGRELLQLAARRAAARFRGR